MPHPGGPPRRNWRTLVLWAALVVTFFVIWRFLQPTQAAAQPGPAP